MDADTKTPYVPTPAPKSDKDCYPFPCESWHETWSHLEGEDPCACPCHLTETEKRAAWGDR